jgi:hypothetical protein
MAEKIVPKKNGAEPTQLELDVANGILNFQVRAAFIVCFVSAVIDSVCSFQAMMNQRVVGL